MKPALQQDVEIRETGPQDMAALESLYPAAFPQEDLLPLVREMVVPGLPVLSLVALARGDVAGHVAFTICGVDGVPRRAALLGPLAVLPALQQAGIGSALVREGLARLPGMQVNVLGDPAYYSRFGFEEDGDLAPPYPLPEDWRPAWRRLVPAGAAPLCGVLEPPAFWEKPALWS